MQVVWQVAIETHIISPVHWKAFMNAFVNLIAFLFLLNPANKSDKKKCPEIGCHSLLTQGVSEIESKHFGQLFVQPH